ncbi:MAG TPA: universal stress protein [Sphingobacteriaceae bacterium]|nr:universal stress protein [Sphingobacteriaceae bacterium]
METILITTDFSQTASNAAKYAAKLSKSLSSKSIILYHSYDDENVDAGLLHEGSVLALEILAERIQKYLGKSTKIELIANDLPLLMGVERICEQHRVGLVVAGSTGKGGLAKFLVGSNTINLAEKCPAPLLVVPDEAEFEPIKKIVFACAMDKVKQSTPVDTIFLFTRQLNSKLLVLNVALEHKRFNPDIIPEQYEIHKLLDELNPSYHYIEEDEIVEGIMDFVEDEGAQLLISVPKSYGFFDSLFRRSVTKKLAYETETPLLVLREPENQHER